MSNDTNSSPITFYNRQSGEIETEQVYGEKALRWAYENPLGKIALQAFIKRPFFSKYYGSRMSARYSRERITPFIEKYGLDPQEFEKPLKDFISFNDFFFRKLKRKARPISKSPAVFPADGRHFVFPDISKMEDFFVKGQRFNLAKLLDDDALAEEYQDGVLLFSRLCPVDYHRFHFPAAGVPSEARLINGPLFSVSPIALSKQLSYLWENKRTVTKLETSDLGTVLCLEVGATCVGSITQTYTPGKTVKKGQEKGYFAFGGSTTITIFKKGAITPAQDLIEQSAQQRETYTLMGDSII